MTGSLAEITSFPSTGILFLELLKDRKQPSELKTTGIMSFQTPRAMSSAIPSMAGNAEAVMDGQE
jgi:hypothetical protein